MIDLKTFEKKLVLRNPNQKDYESITALQKICFPSMTPWTKDQLESQLKIFPEGQYVIEYDNKVVASASSLIIDFDVYTEDHSWEEITDDGYIRNHNPQRNTLYGMEIMVAPEYRGMKLARRLYDARKKLAKERGLMRIVLGGRIPGYAEFKDKLTPLEYVDKVTQKELFDSVLTVQLANGFVLKRLIKHYLDSDRASRGNATLLEWANLDYVSDPAKKLMPTDPVRICVVQHQMRTMSSFHEFALNCEYFVDAASSYKADFILFPEGLTTQLITEAKAPEVAVRTMSDYTEQYLKLFSLLSVKHSINIIGGSHFTVENGNLYNASYLFRRDGTLERQHKLKITPDEKLWWGLIGGQNVQVFDTDKGKIAIHIGCDIEFPEHARSAVERGARLLFVPFSVEERYANLRIRRCAQARAIENYVYVITAGAAGNLPVKNLDIHYAQSGIYTPADISFSWDATVAECQPNVETVIFEDLYLRLLEQGHRSQSIAQRRRQN